MKHLRFITAISSLFLVASLSAAQEAPGNNTAAGDTDSIQTPVDPVAERMDALEQKLNDQSKKIADLEKENEKAKKRDKEKQTETKQLKEDLDKTRDELDSFIMAADTTDNQSKFSVYGFFDTTFYKAWYDKSNSVLKTQNPPKSTFMMNNINLFFKSEMTDSLEALVETGLSFAPLGYETNIPVDAYVDGKLDPELIENSEYERVDTTIPGGIAGKQPIRYGSVSIIRAYLDWKPRDWLNFRVGQYLTPYGIWNEDHASTVLVGVYYPNMMNHSLVPQSQMGLQAFGSIFPADNLHLKYALTFSNGRGPISTVMDLDENKAFGLRLQAIVSGSKWKITAGGYGYYGKYTNLERHAEAYLNTDLSQDLSSGSPIGSSLKGY
jgi:hypothetical protein